MPEVDVESDPLFPLLTDALRAGPGSPEWHQAVAKLRAEGVVGGDEYKLLVAVREHLESGRDYRSITAGPGFTRKVFEGIEQERKAGGKKPPTLPLATIITLISVVAILSVLGYVGYQLIWKSPPTQVTADELATAYFPKTEASALFEAAIPAGWKVIGGLPLEVAPGGLRPGSPNPPATSPTDSLGGAVVAPTTIGADEPFALEVKLKPGKPTEDLIVEIFVANVAASGPDFKADKATSAGEEVVWQLRGGKQSVRASNEVKRELPRVDPDANGHSEPLTIRININRDFAVVFDGTQKLWAGKNGLEARARTVGVRFLRIDPTKPIDPAIVQSILVLKK